MPETRRWSVALLDLDGTVVDSAPGITATLAFTLERMGLPVPPPAQLLRFVGPPILDGFRDIVGLTAEQSRVALGIYRERYGAVGVLDAAVYPGIEQALAAVVDAGLPIALATSKPESLARRVLTHFDLAGRFTVIAGASEDERRSEKAAVITHAVDLLQARGVGTDRPVMVGDRIHDVEGAAHHGIPTLYATWGYGSPAEAAGAAGLVGAPADLPPLLLEP